MMKKTLGFTLAEVLTTLMVIGVVAAMTIPTLMNSTNDQQLKVAYKKAMSVLGQGVQLMVAKEEQCKVNNDGELASCFSKILSGSPGKNTGGNGEANVITTSDGMAYAFYFRGKATDTGEQTLEELCGTLGTGTDDIKADKDAYQGKTAKCFAVVDVNGLGKGAKKFLEDGKSAPEAKAAITTDYANATDQQVIIITGNGVRPLYNSDDKNTKGYEWMFGTTAAPYTGE